MLAKSTAVIFQRILQFLFFTLSSVRLFMTVEEAVVSDPCSISRRYF